MIRYEKSLRFIMSFLPNSRYDPEIADNDSLKSSLRFRNVLASRVCSKCSPSTDTHAFVWNFKPNFKC